MIEVDVKIIHKTENAILVTDDEVKEVWLPKSQVTTHQNYDIGDTLTIEIPEWVAEEKGLI